MADGRIVYPCLPFPSESSGPGLQPEKQTQASLDNSNPSDGLCRTPTKPHPNIGKRRTTPRSLLRTTASPSHSVKMTEIFQTSRTRLQLHRRSPAAPSKRFSSNTKRSRVALGQKQAERQDGADEATEYSLHSAQPCPPPIDGHGMGPDDSLPRSPSTIDAQTLSPLPVRAPSCENGKGVDGGCLPSWKIHRDRGLEWPIKECETESDSTAVDLSPGDAKSSDGEMTYFGYLERPAIEDLDERQTPAAAPRRVEDWLERLVHVGEMETCRGGTSDIALNLDGRDSREDIQKAGDEEQVCSDRQGLGGVKAPPIQRRRLSSDSNKENQRPQCDMVYDGEDVFVDQVRPGVPRFDLVLARGHGSRFGISPSRPLAQQSELRPLIRCPSRFQGHGGDKDATASPKRKRREGLAEVGMGRRICPLDTDTEIVRLSPDVDPFRKGTRPRRDRCASYFDLDILGQGEDHGEDGVEQRKESTESDGHEEK